MRSVSAPLQASSIAACAALSTMESVVEFATSQNGTTRQSPAHVAADVSLGAIVAVVSAIGASEVAGMDGHEEAIFAWPPRRSETAGREPTAWAE